MLQCEKVSPGLVAWHPDYQSAVLGAARSRKPILLFQLVGALDESLTETHARLARTVLFSAPEIALFIMSTFEAAWQSVRSVPTVHIDFGNGKALTKPLHGNIATYLCTADGAVLDVLPGIYDPQSYLFRLQQFEALHDLYLKEGWSGVSRYHAERSRLLNENVPNKLISKVDLPEVPSAHFLMPKGDELHEWETLAVEASAKECSRRLAIHDYLRVRVEHAPHEMTKWLYRDVLNADLDDPYLGMKTLLVRSASLTSETALTAG